MRVGYVALAVVAVASLLLCLSTPPYLPFNEVFDRIRAEEFSRELEESLGLKDGYSRLMFFEVRKASVCAFYARGARSMDDYRGKEWVVRLYYHASLVYELRVDATLGFSSLYVNLTYVESDKALDASLTLIKAAAPGDFRLDVDGALNLSCEPPYSQLCSKALREATRWRGVVMFARMGFQALLLSSLIIAVVLNIPLPKARLVLLTFVPLTALVMVQVLLSMPYRLGKARAAPTLRSAFSLMYSVALYSLLSSIALVAGLALEAKTRHVKIPEMGGVAKGWCLGLALGLTLAALSEVLFQAFSTFWHLLPLGAPIMEEAVSSRLPWLEFALSSAASSVGEEIVFRYMLLMLFHELTKSKVQAISISSIIFALLHVPYPLYPAQAKLLQALSLAMILSLVYMRWGLISAVFAHYTLDVISVSMAIRAIRPFDSLLLLTTLPLSLPIAMASLQMMRMALSTSSAAVSLK